MTTPTAPTPEELAARVVDELNACFDFRDSHIPTPGDADWPPNPGVVSIIAAAIRQHSAPLEAQIAELTEALDDVQTAYCNHVMQQTDANVIAQSVADYGSAEAAVKGLHDFQLRIHRTMIDHYKARATQAEAALAAALEREAAWNETEAATCDRQAAGFKRERTAEGREMHARCDAAADAHRKASRRLRAALQPKEPANG